MTIDELLQRLTRDPEEQYRIYQAVRKAVAAEMIRTDFAFTRISSDLLDLADNPRYLRLALALLSAPLESTIQSLADTAGYANKKGAIRAIHRIEERFEWFRLIMQARNDHLAEIAIGAGRKRQVPVGVVESSRTDPHHPPRGGSFRRPPPPAVFGSDQRIFLND